MGRSAAVRQGIVLYDRLAIRPTAGPDPNLSTGLLQSCPMLGYDFLAIRIYEAAVPGIVQSARSGRSGVSSESGHP